MSAFFALITGGGVSSSGSSGSCSPTASFGIKDPQFHKDIGFYVFRLPFLTFVFDWLFAALIIILIVTAVAHYLNGGIRLQSPFQRVTPQVKAHLSVILPLMALVKTAQYYFSRFELTFSTRGVVEGATQHRRRGPAARAEPPDVHLDRRRRAVRLEHLAPGLGAAGHRRRAVGVRLDRRRHDLPGVHQQFWSSRTSSPRSSRTSRATSTRRVTRSASRRSRSSTSTYTAEPDPEVDRRPTRDDRERAPLGPTGDPAQLPDAAKACSPTTSSPTSTSTATSSTASSCRPWSRPASSTPQPAEPDLGQPAPRLHARLRRGRVADATRPARAANPDYLLSTSPHRATSRSPRPEVYFGENLERLRARRRQAERVQLRPEGQQQQRSTRYHGTGGVGALELAAARPRSRCASATSTS